MKNSLFLLILTLLFVKCSNAPDNVSTENKLLSKRTLIPEPDLTLRLTGQKDQLENLRIKQLLTTEEYYTLEANGKLHQMDSLPKEFAQIITFYKDTLGQIVMVNEFPFSKEENREVFYVHYFDKAGKTFAFKQQINFFNSKCANKDIHKVTYTYYNNLFEKVDQQSSLTDEFGNTLNPKDCILKSDSSFTVFSTRKEVLASKRK